MPLASLHTCKLELGMRMLQMLRMPQISEPVTMKGKSAFSATARAAPRTAVRAAPSRKDLLRFHEGIPKRALEEEASL